MTKLMAKWNLPSHCLVKNRGKYTDVYFSVHPKDRTEGWPATIKMGRTDKISMAEIHERAEETYKDYLAFKDKAITGEDLKIKDGTFPDIIKRYRESLYWLDLSERTKYDYGIFLKEIHEWSKRAGHPHIKLLTPKSIVRWLNNWEDAPRRQKYAKAVMSILFGSAIREGYIEINFVKDIKLRRRKSENKKKIHIWSQEDIDRFIEEADERGLHSLGSIVLTGIETAQRQADVIKMRNGVHYKDGKLIYIQQKTGKKVQFNATNKLRERYEKYPSKQMFMFIFERTGKTWKQRAVAYHVREICDYLGLKEYNFAHLRHSQVFHLHENNIDKNSIRAMTGHTMDYILDNVYLEARNEKLANQGVAKINRVRQKSQTKSQTKNEG